LVEQTKNVVAQLHRAAISGFNGLLIGHTCANQSEDFDRPTLKPFDIVV
jgi:hypothetical protein